MAAFFSFIQLICPKLNRDDSVMSIIDNDREEEEEEEEKRVELFLSAEKTDDEQEKR